MQQKYFHFLQSIDAYVCVQELHPAAAVVARRDITAILGNTL